MAQLYIAQFKWVYLLDIVFFLALAIFAFLDAKKGFIGCFFSFVSTTAAIIVALIFAGVAQKITFGLFGLEKVLAGGLNQALSGIDSMNVDLSQGFDASILSMVSLPSFVENKVLRVINESIGTFPAGTMLYTEVANVLAQFVVLFICAVLLFLATKLLMLLTKKLLMNVADSMGVVRKLNRVLGMCVGLLKVMGITCAVLAVLALLPGEGITNFFNETMILSFLYNHNPIHIIFALFVR